jgi:hypothetical protein
MEEPSMATPAAIALGLAAFLTLAIGLVHSWLGERVLIGPLLAPASRFGLLKESSAARRVLRFAWHLTTLAWWALAAVFLAIAAQPIVGSARQVLAILAVFFLVTGLVVLGSSKGRHLAWPVFLAIAGAAAYPLL